MDRSALCVCALALAWPARAALIASWDFNDSTLLPTVGDGLLTTDFDSVAYVTGTTVNALPLVPAGNALSLQFASGDARAFTLGLDTSLFEDIVVSMAWFRDNMGFNSNHVSWSTDGVNFTALQQHANSPASEFGVQVLDFSSVPAMDDDASVFVRVALGGAGNKGAGVRLDNIQVEGRPIPTPAGLGVLGLAGLGLGRRRR